MRKAILLVMSMSLVFLSACGFEDGVAVNEKKRSIVFPPTSNVQSGGCDTSWRNYTLAATTNPSLRFGHTCQDSSRHVYKAVKEWHVSSLSASRRSRLKTAQEFCVELIVDLEANSNNDGVDVLQETFSNLANVSAFPKVRVWATGVNRRRIVYYQHYTKNMGLKGIVDGLQYELQGRTTFRCDANEGDNTQRTGFGFGHVPTRMKIYYR